MPNRLARSRRSFFPVASEALRVQGVGFDMASRSGWVPMQLSTLPGPLRFRRTKHTPAQLETRIIGAFRCQTSSTGRLNPSRNYQTYTLNPGRGVAIFAGEESRRGGRVGKIRTCLGTLTRSLVPKPYNHCSEAAVLGKQGVQITQSGNAFQQQGQCPALGSASLLPMPTTPQNA